MYLFHFHSICCMRYIFVSLLSCWKHWIYRPTCGGRCLLLGFTVGNILWSTQRCLSVLTILCFYSFLNFDHWTSQRTSKMSPESPVTPCTYWNNNASWMLLVSHAGRFLLLFQPGTCVFPQVFSSIGSIPAGTRLWGTTVHAHKLLGLTHFVLMALNVSCEWEETPISCFWQKQYQ